MSEEDCKATFERCCRLCAEEQDVTIMIFSEEAKAMLLLNKLNKYLLIEVDEDDKLPKNICVTCCTKLHTVCDFIDSARNAQEELLNRSSMLEQFVAEQNITVKTEHKSDEEDSSDDEYNLTEMEISVDPMIILQNCDPPISPNELVDNEQNLECVVQDVTHMHSVDQENVTIKLIRKDKPDSSKPFQCLSTGCDRSFLTEIALKSHAWVHSSGEDKDDKCFKCNTCDASFDVKSDLLAHIKAHKLSGLCQICGRCFRSERNLSAHMAVHLTAGQSYICKVCGRSYNTRSNLKTHSITHSNERPYECHLCKKTFKRNQDLKFHINQHTGAKPYKCPFCEKSFASSGNCYSHRNRMHPGIYVGPAKSRRHGAISRENQPLSFRPIAPKPCLTSVKGMFKYQCTMCDHSFVKRDNFTYHMYQHTGEKPFHCTLCPEKFVTRRGLFIHHNKEHPGKDRPLALISKNVLLK